MVVVQRVICTIINLILNMKKTEAQRGCVTFQITKQHSEVTKEIILPNRSGL